MEDKFTSQLAVPHVVSHGHEAKHQQVHTGGQHGQPEQDEDERHRHVTGLLRERVVLLQEECEPVTSDRGPVTSRSGTGTERS